MTVHPEHAAELEAVRRLGWDAKKLHIVAISYGDVGTADDVAEHLATGDHLSPPQRGVIVAALHDALLERRIPSPFSDRP
jgi:hypothetical protein